VHHFLIALRAELTCMRKASRVLQCQMGKRSSASAPIVVFRLWSLLRRETISWMGSFSGMYGTGGCSCRTNLLHSWSLMPSGAAFASHIVRRPCTNRGVEITSFLKEESGGVAKKRWSLDLEERTPETLLLLSRWIRAHASASETSGPLN
jgi:hypothetical protein